MSKKEFLFVVLFFIFLIGVFFYKTFLYGQIPFPGDLLVSEYQPWKSYFYMGYSPGSFPNKAQYFDVIRQLYPWKTLALNNLKNLELPLWNPYNFSGTPLLANFQSAALYPLNIFYFLMPQIAGWTILVALQPFLAGLFTYLYARKIRISIAGGLFAGISFAFSSFMTVWLQYNTIGHVFLYLPLIFLAVEHILEKFSFYWTIIFVFSLVFSFFGGHPQIFFSVFILTIFYITYRLFTHKKITNKKNIGTVFGVLSLLVLGLCSIILIPGIELIRNAARTELNYDFLINKILIQPWQLVMFFVPDFFGNPATRNYWLSDTYIGKVTSIGHVPIFFISLAILKGKDIFIRFFFFLAILILLLATINPLSILLYKMGIPIVSTSAPTLLIFIFCFSISILCGFGIDLWRKESLSLTKCSRIICVIIGVYAVLWIAVFLLPKISTFSWLTNLSISMRNLLYSTLIVLVGLTVLSIGIVKPRTKYMLLVLLLLIHVGDGFRAFHKFNPFSKEDAIFPQTPVISFLQQSANINRFWGYGNAFIEANIETQYSLFSPDGYDPLYIKRYGEFIHSSFDGKILRNFSPADRSDAVVAPGFGQEDLFKNTNRLRVLDVLGIKYVLDRVENGTSEKTFPEDRFSLVYQKDGWRVFNNKNVTPRAFLTQDYQVFLNREDFEKTFFSKNFDPSKTILLEEKIEGMDSVKADTALPLLSIYAPNKVIFDTNERTNKLLFFSDAYYPGWKALIDNKETKIYRANYAFRAVLVPSGAHKITFTYTPSSVLFGKLISIGSFLTFIVLLCILYKIRYRLYNK